MSMNFGKNTAAPPTSQSHFATVPRADLPRSKFDRSHTRKQTMNADLLYPIYYDEILPGDTLNLRFFSMARMVAPIKPIMDNLYADVFWIYVPNRLLSSKWESIQGQQPDPGTDVSGYAVTPLRFSNEAVAEKSIHDYLGLRPFAAGFTKDVNPFYHLAYNFAWNELFRDQNLQDPVYFDPTESTAYDPSDFQLLPRGKRHDYFTSCLPFPQKGPDVPLPLGSQAPLFFPTAPTALGTNLQLNNGNPAGFMRSNSDVTNEIEHSGALTGMQQLNLLSSVTIGSDAYADLSESTASTINALREAFQVQRLYERDARGGTRYIEMLLSHFGVTSPDFRLQRPEVLGVSSTKITISPIPQTSESGNDPLGTLGAVGFFSHNGDGFVKSFVEHGVVLGLMAIRADLTYQQGMHRSYNRFSRLDFAMPVLAHLGEQEVLNQEIYVQGDAVLDGSEVVDYQTFGFQERYAEYRYKPSEICGEFRSDNSLSLDVWHLAQDFANLPVLNDEFIESDTPMERVLTVTDQDQFEVDMAFKMTHARVLPVYGVPGMIDHF